MKNKKILLVISFVITLVLLMSLYDKKKDNLLIFPSEEVLLMLKNNNVENSYIKRLGKYNGIKYKKVNIKITEEEIDAYIDSILNSCAEIKYYGKNKKIENGDIVFADLCIEYKNQIVDVSYNEKIIEGKNEYNKNVEQAILGHKKGETLEINTPAFGNFEYVKDNVKIKITINDIGKYINYELTDELVTNKLGFRDVKEFYRNVENEMNLEKTEREYIQECYSIINDIINNSEFIIDEDEVSDYALSIVDQYIELYDISNEQENQYANGRYDISHKLFSDCYDEALREVEQYLVIGAIAERESYKVTKEDYINYCEKNDIYDDEIVAEDKMIINYFIIRDKVFDLIHNNKNIIE